MKKDYIDAYITGIYVLNKNKKVNNENEKEALLSTVYRYFYDCKNKMKEKDYIDAYISGISVKEDEACGASFYYKTGFYDVYCDYHHNICSIYVYTSDYKEIKIKGSIELNSYKKMFIDVSINENNYKAILYMLNEYIESITTTISSGGTVTCDENILIMNTEKLLEMYIKENHKKEIDNMKKEDMKELMKLALNLKHGLINCCDGYFKDHLNVQIVSINPVGDFIVKVSGLNIILDDESTNVVAEIKVESTQKEGVYYIKNDHLAGNSFGISKVICSNENRLPIIKDELKNSFNRIEEFLKYTKEEEKLENKKNKDQYDAIVKSVSTIKYKLFNQLLDYDLSKSINFDILDLESEKNNSVRFLITADFTHIPVAEVEITMNGLNDIDIDGSFFNENNKIHCNNIDELRSELDNIIVNVASTIGKVRDNIYNIEFRQIKDFVWTLNNMILKDEEFKIETIYHNYKDIVKIEFLINSENKNNFIVVEETRDYKFLIKYELFGLSSHKHFTKSDELNNYIQTLYEKIKHVVKSLG